MGMAIYACSKVDYIGSYDEELDEDKIYADGSMLEVIRGNPEAFEKRMDGWMHGVYKKGNNSEATGFPCGSYGWYNKWRNDLCKIFLGIKSDELYDLIYDKGNIELTEYNNWDELKSKMINDYDFIELINFSDCEGFIGPITSNKLYKDFIRNKDRYINGIKNLYPVFSSASLLFFLIILELTIFIP